MQESIKILQDVLVGNQDIDVAIGDVESLIQEKTNYSLNAPVLRCLYSLRQNKIIDFAGHLRQCMMYFTCSFNIQEDIYTKLFEVKNLFGFIFNTKNGFNVNISKDILPNHKQLKTEYKFEKMRKSVPSIADGRLYRHFGYSNYTSISQKFLQYFIANMEKNETILACLPTGGGKSLSWQLPAISKSYQGLIIVVVPTVALAIDHERSSKEIYENSFSFSTLPMAYYSGIDKGKKTEIYQAIQDGSLPILYISPEALLNNEFQESIIEASKNGKVSALIIDEAHLIVNWGVRFRPEFQLLSTFRNKLKNVSTLGIKTILLSATYTEEDTEIIRGLFSEEVFTEFRADELRTEPSYYMHKCKSEIERLDLISQIVCQAPRPIIVYAVSPDEGNKLYSEIEKIGFKNISQFNGETKNNEREIIIDKWNKNEIDIIVATSAFGMGVDKSDVRTVVTSYIPESISRYYQEVGRAGRDGYSSLNYFLTFGEIDNDYVSNLTKGTVLTVETMVLRWKELLANAERLGSDSVWVDINIPPEHLKYTIVGKRNASWNKDVVLFLYRIGMIEILEVKNSNFDEFKILIRLKNIPVLENTDRLSAYLEDFREQERERITNGINNVRLLLNSTNKNCFSSFFIKEFPYAVESCSGCPYCRKHSLENYYRKPDIYVSSTKSELSYLPTFSESNVFSILLSTSKEILIKINSELNDVMLSNCIEFLIKNNFNIIITNNTINKEKLMEQLNYYDNFKYLILTLDEAKMIDIEWLSGLCAFIYSDDYKDNMLLYEFAVKHKFSASDNKVVHIALDDLYVKSERKNLSEVADHSLNAETLILKGVKG